MGKTSTSLSFKQKLFLISDLKQADSSDFPKFEKLAEIRNQFAHNYDVNDFTSCFENLEGVEKFLQKRYSTELASGLQPRTHEEKLTKMYGILFDDVLRIVSKIMDSTIKSVVDRGKEIGKLEAATHILNSIKDYSATDSEFEEKFIRIVKQARETLGIETPNQTEI